MANRLGLAILGAGRAGLKRLQKLATTTEPLAEIRYVMERDMECADEIKSSVLPHTPVVSNPWKWENVIRDDSVDAIMICSPYINVNMVRRALRQGKAVMCDRPISLQMQALLACYEEAEVNKIPLLFAFSRRYDPTLVALKEKLDTGDLGEIHTLRMNTVYGNISDLDYLRISGGLFKDCVTHDVDTACWLLNGTPDSVYASAGTYLSTVKRSTDLDSVGMVLRYPTSGTMATLDVQRSKYNHDQKIEDIWQTTSLHSMSIHVCGTNGVILLENHGQEGATIQSITKQGNRTTIFMVPQLDREDDAFVSAAEHFVAVMTGSEVMQMSITDTLRATSIALKCQESHRSNLAVSAENFVPSADKEQAFLWKERPDMFMVDEQHPSARYHV